MLQRMNARRRVLSEREHGFSLVELVVAMFILGLILTLLIGIQISSMVTVAEARKREQATAFANEAIEQMRAIPWAVLASGLDSNFNDGGIDPLVNSSDQLVVDGQTRAVRQSTQDATDEWTPILIKNAGGVYGAGSNVQERTDPSIAGTTFTIKAYVLEPTVADTSIVTLAAVVEWPGRNGTSRTVIWSEAFRGDACNSAQQNVQPYLTGCQAYFSAESASGTFSTSVDASVIPDTETDVPYKVNLLYPTGDIFYSFFVRSATTSAILQSQQTTTATGYLQYGSTSIDDNNPDTQVSANGWLNGGAVFELSSDNDVASALTTNPSDVSITQVGGDEAIRYVTTGGTSVNFWGRSDYARPGTVDASMTSGCVTGVPADSGCAVSSLSNSGSVQSGSAYTLMEVGGTSIRLARRLAESHSNADESWVARFPTAPGTSASVGCVTNSEPGCVSAGASRSSADISIGAVIDGDWDGSAAASGLVRVTGNSGSCSTYTESVLVQRGFGFEETDPISSRCGTVYWWTDTGYQAFDLSAATSRSEVTEPVTATFGDYTVVATAGVNVTGSVDAEDGTDPDCIDEACVATVDSGSITIIASYTITYVPDPTRVYTVTATTQLSGMRASATYLEPSDA